jgi:hypothetical protein
VTNLPGGNTQTDGATARHATGNRRMQRSRPHHPGGLPQSKFDNGTVAAYVAAPPAYLGDCPPNADGMETRFGRRRTTRGLRSLETTPSSAPAARVQDAGPDCQSAAREDRANVASEIALIIRIFAAPFTRRVAAACRASEASRNTGVTHKTAHHNTKTMKTP